MNHIIETIYLVSVFIFLLILLINLSLQLISVYRTEKKLQSFQLTTSQKLVNESLSCFISQLYLKTYQWIEAIQVLQITLKQKQLHVLPNKYSLVNLNNALGYIYFQANKKEISSYYFKQAIKFSPKNNRLD